ncbi:MAG TPA: hypothetical protein DD670_19250 [Planctomycetaceae bacterium]|nr:hypothetical protein [Planctomycetaceae bacterium]
MGGLLAFLVAGVVALFVLGILLAGHPVGRWRGPRLDQAQLLFRLQREQIEAKFVDLAQVAHNRGTPRWLDCEFDNDVTYVRNRRTGQLAAFVGVMVILPGGGPLGDSSRGRARDAIFYQDRSVPTMGVIRSATAVFTFANQRWTTDGRAVFNLSPAETANFYQHDLKIVGHEPAARTVVKR